MSAAVLGNTSLSKFDAIVVGGGTIHADLKMPRFRPTDFQLGTLIGGQVQGTTFADWPVTYAQLEPSGFNPTLTIMTLATYVAANIAYPGSPQNAIK